ncbi:MAG: hypothetical protein WB869_12485 [Candidatus Acidiferrales bacterium]
MSTLPPPSQFSKPPKILQIYRDFPKLESFSDYAEIEEDAARICVELHCPHPFLAMESITSPKEVWFLSGFKSQADRDNVVLDYANNSALKVALQQIAARKSGLIADPIELFANFRPGMSRGLLWTLGQSNFVVATLTLLSLKVEGTVYETEDGKRLIMKSAQSRGEAQKLAAASPDTQIFAVRPQWSMPGKNWTIAGG